jgi:nitronate monooxygenase
MWTKTRITQLLGIDRPILLAPLGGGPSTPALVAAVSEAGGIGTLAGGYLTPEKLRDDIAAVRAMTERPFIVNLFALQTPPMPPREVLERANRALDRYRDELGIAHAPLPERFEEDFAKQVEVVIEAKPAAFSFTFGIPRAEVLDACRRAGIPTIGTATHLDEGKALQDAGVDAVTAQGVEAGGHRGTFLGAPERGHVGTLGLVTQLVNTLTIPVIAAGGIMNGRGIAAVLALGADAAALGTAFMLAPEAGTSAPYRQALKSGGRHITALTTAFSGKEARGIVNRFLAENAGREMPAYPYQNALTRDIRAAAAKAGRAEFLSLWAGQAAALAEELPARELVARFVRETEEAVQRLSP